MNGIEILKKVEVFEKKLPKFPDGRINYSASDIALVICVFVKYKNKILLLKRSNYVGNYSGKWDVVTGFFDELKSIEYKVLKELNEELNLNKDYVISMIIGNLAEIKDKEINRIWIICPVIVELNQKPKIKLNRENTEYKWVEPEKMEEFDIIPNIYYLWKNGFV